MLAAFGRITTVIGAGVSVVTGEISGAYADALDTLVTAGTGVLIVTRCRVGRVHAALDGITGIVGTGVLVVAVQCSRADTGGVLTMIKGCAGVPVRAGVVIGLVFTAGDWITTVGCTGVSVVTVVEDRRWCTDPFRTDVSKCAGVPIVTGIGVEFVEAANQGLAPIGGAGVVVVAI
tara:strand:+ start:369 stop:896 length:528 start_codon:yes stop_codon:yes gene_type:complete